MRTVVVNRAFLLHVEQDGRARISLLRQAIMEGATEWIRTIVATHMEDDLTARDTMRWEQCQSARTRTFGTVDSRAARPDASAKRLRL